MFKKNFFNLKNLLDLKLNSLLYLLAFLLPLFFLPLTFSPVFLNKQLLLSAGVFFVLILWMIKVIWSGRLTLDFGKISKAVILFLLAIGLSTIFSSARVHSFWQADQSDTFFNLLLCGLVFFAFANLIRTNKNKVNSKKPAESNDCPSMTLKVLSCFLASSGIMAFLFLIQAFTRNPIFPWDFSQSIVFNTIGTVEALGIFLGGAFILLLSLISGSNQHNIKVKSVFKKIIPVLSVLLGILLFLCIVLINYWVVWLGVIVGMVLILAQMTKTMGPILNQKEIKRFLIPLVLLAIALVFVFVNIPMYKILNYSPEPILNYSPTFEVGFNALTSSPKNFILGTGPATFVYQYDLFKPLAINFGMFWQSRFSQGTSFLATLLPNIGVLGILTALLLLVAFLWQGIRPLLKSESSQRGIDCNVSSSIFATGFYFFLVLFLYPSNLVLLFSLFLMLGLFVGVQKKAKIKEFAFSQSPQKAFFIMIIAVLIMACSGIGLYKVSQRYTAAIYFNNGLSLFGTEDPDLDKGAEAVLRAADMDSKDDYFRNLSQAFILKINHLANNQDLSDEDSQKLIQNIVTAAENSVSQAVQLNPKNSQNWIQQGRIYQNFIVLGMEGAEAIAISSYQKAFELAPTTPEIPLNIGQVYYGLIEANAVQIAVLEQTDPKDEEQIQQFEDIQSQLLEAGIGQINKAIELKGNFVPAYYLLGQIYEVTGDNELALEAYNIVLQFLPDNEEVQQKIEKLSE